MAYDEDRLEQELKIYYKNLFPVKPIVDWLRYDNDEYFRHREFAFIRRHNVHIRHRSFLGEEALHRSLMSTNPQKLDIGAVFNYPPVQHRQHSDFRAMGRELVFDIDLSDYDSVRICCQKTNVCPDCWKFIVMAARILDFQLVDLFGFKSRLWVYSGRRGIHCWVADKSARSLDNSARSAIFAKLNLFKPNGVCEVTEGRKGLTRYPTHIKNAFKQAMKDGLFEDMITDQGWLELEDWIDEYLWSTPYWKHRMPQLAEKYPYDWQRWNLLRALFDEEYRNSLDDYDEMKHEVLPALRDVYYFPHFVLKRVGPRLDKNVTITTNHLLKSPFAVHPATGNIAVPLKFEDIAKFDVKNPPRIDQVIEEFKNMEVDPDDPTPAYKRGILAPYVEHFEDFVKNIKL